MEQYIKDCAAEHEHRMVNKEKFDAIYDAAYTEYCLMEDWNDVALNCESEIPILMAMVAKQHFGLAETYLKEVMLVKAAKQYADTVAENSMAPGW